MNLKKLRIRRNVSQTDLCRATGITQATYSMIENGRHKPSFNTIKKLAEFYEMTSEELYDYE